MSNTFLPNRPKSILYSVHTRTICHRPIRVVLGKRFQIFDIVGGQNYNELATKEERITRVGRNAQDTRSNEGVGEYGEYATTAKKVLAE